MIIVSQDKTRIINYDNILQLYISRYIKGAITEYYIRYEDYNNSYEDIGAYKTEERAKEVLQEIVKATIETRKSQELNNLFGGAGIIPSNTYYEMPED